MKRKSFKLIVSMILLTVVSCDEPETVVTNFVHPDGSVTRRIEMRSPNTKSEDRFKQSDLQIPYDNTWTVTDSCEVNEKGDTTWIRTAIKDFKNADLINLSYNSDSGANKDISRSASFKKSFKWFNTEYRFAEKIDRNMLHGYPISDFLNAEELEFYYSPGKGDLQNGPDSLRYRAFEDTITIKTDQWMYKSIVSEWIAEFSKLTEGRAGDDISDKSLKMREDEFVKLIKVYDSKFDSLWKNGTILKALIGESNAMKYKSEADSAISIVTKKVLIDFKEYKVKNVMPGQVIGTNGFIDSTKTIFWPVKSDYFLTEPYEMWAESKAPNTWAWIVSGLFLLFVGTGIVIRVIKKG